MPTISIAQEDANDTNYVLYGLWIETEHTRTSLFCSKPLHPSWSTLYWMENLDGSGTWISMILDIIVTNREPEEAAWSHGKEKNMGRLVQLKGRRYLEMHVELS